MPSNIYATVITPGYVVNELIVWLLKSKGIRFTLIDRKPREAAKMEAMRSFLNDDLKSDRWLLINHYANPQFNIEDVPDEYHVVSANMRRVRGLGKETLIGNILEENEELIKTDFVPNGCLFLSREAVQSICNKRPFEFKHNIKGELLSADDKTMSDLLIDSGYDLWLWKRGRCLNLQKQFI